MNILAVIVRYKTPVDQSQTIQSLAEAFKTSPDLLQNYGVLLWDNSPTPLENPRLPFPFQYGFSEENLGVSGAYNKALDHAESIRCPWLLLLDQDTTLTADYLHRMLQHANELHDDPRIATIVPFVRSHTILVSPQKMGLFPRGRQFPRSFSGVCLGDAHAINSGTVMRTVALREVGGYSDDFWLDFSDIYVFHALYRHGKYMYVAGDLELTHSIASMDFDRQMTLDRYRNFLAAENAYIALYRPPLANLAQTLWLFGRVARQYQRYKNKQFSRLALHFLIQRLFWSKAARLANWRSIMKGRSIPAVIDGNVVG